MSSSAVMEAAGCFGKVPQLGDFVSSSLPRTFVDPWDDFLRELLTFSQEALGDTWLDTYLYGPIWRFALAADCAGPSAVMGTLMPSVDRVGRYFPLTIAVLVAKAPSAPSQDAWFEQAETLSLETLSAEFDASTLPNRLEKLGRPDSEPNPSSPLGAVWWTLGARSLAPLALRSTALPRGIATTVLLDGDVRRWGWEAEPIRFDSEPDGKPNGDH